MRIGIVTQPLEMNYGGILQNWALQQVLKRLGHAPITIDAYQRFSTPHYVYNWVRGKFMRMMGKKANMPLRYHGAMRSKQTGRFIEKHISKTRVMWDYKPSLVKKYRLEGLVVGSDQVWRFGYNSSHIEDVYLRFAYGKKLKRRIAYAASFGVDEWDYPQEKAVVCAQLAQQMDFISVREENGIDLCRKYLGVEARCVLDPTLLLGAQDYQEIIDSELEQTEPYLAIYCLDITQAKREFFNHLAGTRGLKPRYYSAGWKADLTVEQWLATLSHASMVVTDSFHGTVFSILFGREFYTMCNFRRGNTRISGLLEQLGLENRLISDTEPVEPADCVIDWRDVYSRLDVKRKESINFLENALKV